MANTREEIIAGLDLHVPEVQNTAGELDTFKQTVKIILSKDDVLQLEPAQKQRLLDEWAAKLNAHIAAVGNLDVDLVNWEIPPAPEEA
jgi:hypothetical protein